MSTILLTQLRTNLLFLTSKDFEDFLSAIAPLPGDLLLFGDFNLHLELLTDSNTSNFYNLLKQFSLEQLIKSATHIKGGILDLIIKSNALKISWPSSC